MISSMTHRPSQTSAFASSVYEPWYWHFREKHDVAGALPWHHSNLLCSLESRLVARSIQQFQLGEWARGGGLMRRASAHPVLSTDLWFLPSLELFIAEEQHHSEMLGRFLDRERIPRLSAHWIDSTFRRLRKLAGLELCAMVLVTAEVLAMPFYQALRDATRSHLLGSICVHILRDEAAHLHYQALTLGLVRRPLRNTTRSIHSFCHSMLFHCTALLLWQQHYTVFRAAGWDFPQFWKRAGRRFTRLQLRIRHFSSDSLTSESAHENNHLSSHSPLRHSSNKANRAGSFPVAPLTKT
jgi:hypothetical protein